ncbi:MAG: RNA polymerase sigma factor [Deltaproteobacteria bacterium]|nr:RNA polymerase sigma factor [Deltaproteobacteria bacterium]
MKKPENDASDLDIITQVLNGEVNAFACLIERHKKIVFRIVNNHMAAQYVEETAHDVFVRAYRSLAHFNNKGDFKNWLSSIAVRTCYDFWRKKYRSREVPISSLSDQHVDWLERTVSSEAEQYHASASRQIEARELLDLLLAKLSPADRMVLELVHLQEYSCREAAELLGWSVANVKIRTYRARARLKTVFKGLQSAKKSMTR